MKKIHIIFIIFIIFGLYNGVRSQDDTDFTKCKAYLDGVNAKIAAKQFGQIPQSFTNTILYSGKMLNDEGEVEKCRSTEGMTFVRLTLAASGLEYYRGYCLDQVCNAAVLNANQAQAYQELTTIVNTIISLFTKKQGNNTQEEELINKNDSNSTETNNNIRKENNLKDNQPQISFVPYQEDTQSKANAAFIIGVMSISLCLIASIVGPILKAINAKSKKNANFDETRYQTLINYAQQGATSLVSNSNSQISRPSHTLSGPSVSVTGGNTQSQVSQSATSKPRREPLWYKCLQCWNVRENVQKMFTLKSNNDDLLVFNGIRSICFMQVIFGHEFYLHMNYMSNPNDLMIAQTKPFILFLFSCLYSVDVFFWLGGFFLSYVVADEKQARNFSMKKPMKAMISFAFAIINRVFRILPCYFVVLMFFWKIAPYTGSSPTWDVFMNSASNCDERWWQNLLFIDNMFGGQKQKCFGWGWYLSNDFQMFIGGMILLIIYQNNRFFGKIAIFVSFIAFQVVSIVLSYKWNFKVPVNIVNLGVDHYYDDYYTKPWTRASPYLIGLLFGVLYKEHQFDKSKNKRNSILTLIQKSVGQSYWKYASYGLGFLIYFFLVFGPRALQVNGLDSWPIGFQNFWFGTCRTFYVIAVSFLVLPGMLGSKDLIVKFFSCKLFAFLQRLSFGGYLTHYIIILFALWQSNDAVYYDSENLIGMFFSEFLLTLIASAIVALIIEIPIMNLSGILLGGKKPSSTGPQKLERVKLEELTAENSSNDKSLNINKSISNDNENTKSITVQSKQIK